MVTVTTLRGKSGYSYVGALLPGLRRIKGTTLRFFSELRDNDMKLVNPLPEGVSYLYHYTSTDMALDCILKNKTLKFNPFKAVNDPRENREWDFSPRVPGGSNLEPDQYDAISRDISELLKANAKLLCFCRDKDEAVRQWQPEALFNRGFCKPSMWHHYGNSHDGVCLMFDKAKLNLAFQRQLRGKPLIWDEVKYSNKGIIPNLQNDPFCIDLILVKDPQGYLSAILGHASRWHKELFFTKLIDWANDDEYRWAYLDDTPEPLFVSFDDALEAVVIGAHVPDVKTQAIRRYCIEEEAEMANLNWRNGFPRIENPLQPYITPDY